jgi:uncharacterized membrane protein YdjX (TVP38/TMEM64 family)
MKRKTSTESAPVSDGATLEEPRGGGIKESKPLHISLLFVLFGLALALLGLIFHNIPTIESRHHERLKLPTNFQEVKDISEILSMYTDNNYYSVMAAFGAVYIFLQAFSIPGSIFLSFLSGALFGVAVGVPFVCLMATIGATCSYMLSYYICRNLVRKFFPMKLALFAAEVSKHRHNILNYILFLRITPFLPNWFINLASPVLGVPVMPFVVATFFGVMPATYFAVKAGLTLHELNHPSDIFDTTAILTLAFLALLSVLPTLQPIRRRLDTLING